MLNKHTRLAGGGAAVAAAGLAGYSLRPSGGPQRRAVAARNPAAEVRTEVIRRTIHIVKHELPAGRRPRPHARRLRGRAPHGRRAASEHRREPPFRGSCRRRCWRAGDDAHELSSGLVGRHGRTGVEAERLSPPGRAPSHSGSSSGGSHSSGAPVTTRTSTSRQRLGVLRISGEAGPTRTSGGGNQATAATVAKHDN